MSVKLAGQFLQWRELSGQTLVSQSRFTFVPQFAQPGPAISPCGLRRNCSSLTSSPRPSRRRHDAGRTNNPRSQLMDVVSFFTMHVPPSFLLAVAPTSSILSMSPSRCRLLSSCWRVHMTLSVVMTYSSVNHRAARVAAPPSLVVLAKTVVAATWIHARPLFLFFCWAYLSMLAFLGFAWRFSVHPVLSGYALVRSSGSSVSCIELGLAVSVAIQGVGYRNWFGS